MPISHDVAPLFGVRSFVHEARFNINKIAVCSYKQSYTLQTACIKESCSSHLYFIVHRENEYILISNLPCSLTNAACSMVSCLGSASEVLVILAVNFQFVDTVSINILIINV